MRNRQRATEIINAIADKIRRGDDGHAEANGHPRVSVTVKELGWKRLRTEELADTVTLANAVLHGAEGGREYTIKRDKSRGVTTGFHLEADNVERIKAFPAIAGRALPGINEIADKLREARTSQTASVGR